MYLFVLVRVPNRTSTASDGSQVLPHTQQGLLRTGPVASSGTHAGQRQGDRGLFALGLHLPRSALLCLTFAFPSPPATLAQLRQRRLDRWTAVQRKPMCQRPSATARGTSIVRRGTLSCTFSASVEILALFLPPPPSHFLVLASHPPPPQRLVFLSIFQARK